MLSTLSKFQCEVFCFYQKTVKGVRAGVEVQRCSYGGNRTRVFTRYLIPSVVWYIDKTHDVISHFAQVAFLCANIAVCHGLKRTHIASGSFGASRTCAGKAISPIISPSVPPTKMEYKSSSRGSIVLLARLSRHLQVGEYKVLLPIERLYHVCKNKPMKLSPSTKWYMREYKHLMDTSALKNRRTCCPFVSSFNCCRCQYYRGQKIRF